MLTLSQLNAISTRLFTLITKLLYLYGMLDDEFVNKKECRRVQNTVCSTIFQRRAIFNGRNGRILWSPNTLSFSIVSYRCILFNIRGALFPLVKPYIYCLDEKKNTKIWAIPRMKKMNIFQVCHWNWFYAQMFLFCFKLTPFLMLT